MTNPRCPICQREVTPRSAKAESEAPPQPFCSPRCKLIDLGNWLDGSYRIPGPSALSEEDEDGDGEHLPS